MKNRTYNTVGKFIIHNRKKSEKRSKPIPQAHVFMTAHTPDMA
jgi:hypothetical protein